MDNVAIVAHFDANDHVEANFVELLACLSRRFDRVILVTTSRIEQDIAKNFPEIVIIRRPNFGYDFFSYRVGLIYAKENFQVESALLVNSSFALLSSEVFDKTLSKMLKMGSEYDVVGSTESYQFSWHLQSYLILLGSLVLTSPWFFDFLDGVEPTSSKLETITRFEIGLSSAFRSNNVRVAALLQPSPEQLERASQRWGAGDRQYTWGLTFLPSPTSPARRFNPVHHLAELVARELGYIKLEVLRDNPHQVDLAFVDDVCEQGRLREIQEMLSHSRSNYSRGSDNLSTLKIETRGVPAMKLARWRRTNVGQIEVAVIVHIHYIDMIASICNLLKNIVVPFDIHVTTTSEGFFSRIFDEFSGLAQSISVYSSENRGRDIGPFVSVYRSGALDQYQAVLKIHSKKSTYSANGVLWRDKLYGSVAGDSLTVLRSIELIKSGDVGIVGPHRYYLTNDRFWGANRETVRRLLEEMTAFPAEENLELGFFAGSMFWFAPKALAPLKIVPEDSLIFESENGQQDGTLAHAIERVFCPLVRSQGFAASSVLLRGADIQGYSSLENDVPVL
ncbi:rhamnan synthesis F family protein [Mesorhizobium sp. B263B2A]|uniref:rhamnan synthesis F family protein n=1 Tax=Mesorhizobium sp. B263B2A TaxID=2876669 RepID=UPI001CD0CBA8|nr:rhamnan synthesis F family protein [Mesorhizobium sp. B263B2A]MCA0029725.1 rhamnan synthesis F family protein [Mesorhizobium sp. B263B2A]